MIRAIHIAAVTMLALIYLVILGAVLAGDYLREHRIEALATLCGLAGAWLLAIKGEYAALGWWAFLASNGFWLAFAWTRGHWFLLLQQLGFTASSLWGIRAWTA